MSLKRPSLKGWRYPISATLVVNRLSPSRCPPPGTTANLTFQISPDGGNTWIELYDNAGDEVVVDAAANIFIQIDPTQFRGLYTLIVRSGTVDTPVDQSAQAIGSLLARGIG